MSRSNQTDIKTPAKRFFEWSGSEGKFKYYDKEKKENFFVELPFEFLVLDQLSTITGWSEVDKSGIWSNEIKDFKENFIVKTSKGKLCEGKYSEIKNELAARGGKFSRSIYIAFIEDDEMKIGNLKLHGSALSWIDFSNSTNVYDGKILVKDFIDAKKGATKYKIPIFEKTLSTSDENRLSMELDKELQAYLKLYFARNGVTVKEGEVIVRDESENGEPFPEYNPTQDELEKENSLF